MIRRAASIAALTTLIAGTLSAQGAPHGVIVSGPIAARADSALTALETQGMSGAFLVANGGQVILQKGYGFANRESRRAFSPDIVTQIGSCTKDFTAVAVLQLAERGRLSLDDKITRWFPAAPADKEAITVAQLLDHTAGFEEYSGGDFDAVTRDQFVAHMMASTLRSVPGRSEQYSNPGYGLLAAIIEQVSGTSYDEYVRDNILQPLGLRDTGFLLPRFDLSRVSHGYGKNGDNGTILEKPHAADGPYWNLRGNGGMVSTVGDMFRFYESLFTTERLLKFSSRHGRFAPDEPVGLAGGDGTHFFLYERRPRAGVAYIIATNNAAFQGPRVRLPLEKALGISEQ
jgi:CubicO group peptidase (beta-lactamase class C family)